MFRFHSLSLAVVSLKGGTKMPSDYKADLNAFLKTNKGSVGRWETRHLSEYFQPVEKKSQFDAILNRLPFISGSSVMLYNLQVIQIEKKQTRMQRMACCFELCWRHVNLLFCFRPYLLFPMHGSNYHFCKCFAHKHKKYLCYLLSLNIS